MNGPFGGRTAWFFGALAVVVAGCGDDKSLGNTPPHYPVPGCESFDTPACDIRASDCEARLFALAACLHGGDPADMPPTMVMSTDDYHAYLEAQVAQQMPDPEQDHFEAAYEALGLTTAEALDPETEITNRVNAIGGFYDWNTKQVYVIDHGTNSTPETTSPVLLHEFVHSLQDREVDLTSFHALHDATYDAWLAADAIVEGEARFQEQRYMASMLGLNPETLDFASLYSESIESAEEQLAQSDSALTAALELYPYAWGSRYVHLDWDASGHSGVLGLFADPPAQTHREMASVTERAEEIVAPAITAPAPPAEWTLLGEDSLGALGVFELFGARTDLETAQSFALDWRTDELAVYGGTDASSSTATAVVWACDFGDAKNATLTAGMLGGFGVTARASGTRVVVARATDGVSLDWAFAALSSP